MTLAPLLQIDTPVSPEGYDLSDHYPIRTTIDGLKLISWNLQFMHRFIQTPLGKQNPEEVTQTAEAMADYFVSKEADICCVQELFDSKANEAFVAAMEKRGYVATSLLGASRSFQVFNGGVRSFVRRSMVKTDTIEHYHYYFKTSIDWLVGGDAVANKGVQHFILQDQERSQKTHIFNVHFQAQYPEIDRTHYEEVTLAQAIELKQFIKAQEQKGIIRADDKIIICGDFNIHQPASLHEEDNFAYEKMKLFFGKRYCFPEFEKAANGGLRYTRSRDNIHVNENERNENLDVIATVASNTSTSPEDAAVEQIYCDIQQRIVWFVMDRATLLSLWKLSTADQNRLAGFNRQFQHLMEEAKRLKDEGIHPANDTEWCQKAKTLCPLPAFPRLASMVRTTLIVLAPPILILTLVKFLAGLAYNALIKANPEPAPATKGVKSRNPAMLQYENTSYIMKKMGSPERPGIISQNDEGFTAHPASKGHPELSEVAPLPTDEMESQYRKTYSASSIFSPHP